MNLNNYLLFSHELDQHCQTQDGFFNINLLLLVEKYFQFKNIAIVLYKDNRVFNAVGINDAKVMYSPYLSNYYAVDEFSSLLTQKYEGQDVQYPFVIKSSECFGSSYTKTSYYEFLTEYGFKWSACLMFGKYRITFFKYDYESDFSDEETDILKTLYMMILNRRQLQKKWEKAYVLCSFKDEILDTMDIGTVVLDGDYNPIHYNNKAINFITQAVNNHNIRYGIKRIVEMLENGESSPIGRRGNKNIMLNSLNVNMDTHFQINSNNLISTYYYMTLSDQNTRNSKHGISKKIMMSKHGISSKEFELIELIIQGKSNQQVADELFISINTVRTHIKSIYRKLNINNQRDLLIFYNNLLR